MTAKQFLKQYEYASQRAERLREVYESVMETIDAIGSTLGSDGMPHGSGISRKTENKAIKLADAAMRWKEAELDALEVKQEVFNMIWDIPDIEGRALYERYINLLTWKEVADKVHYSIPGIYNVRERALRIVDERLGNNE